MVSNRTIQSFFIVLLLEIFLWAGCGNQSADIAEDGKAKGATRDSGEEEELLSTASSIEPTESEVSQGKPIQSSSPEKAENEPAQQESPVEVDWGREVDLDEMIAMARDDRIREIQWHVMPNILRAEASDGQLFHLRNENKGVDLRNTLLDAGVRIGKGGVQFRHVF